MMRKAALLCVLVAGCSSPSPPPPPQPPPPTGLPISVDGSAGWAITQGSNKRGLTNGAFDFQVCNLVDNPQNPAEKISPCWDSYVEVLYGANLSFAKSVTLTYEITGTDPVFSAASPGNTCPGNPALTLLLHRTNDAALTVPTYRQFSVARQDLAIGQFTFTVTIDQSNWVGVYGDHNFGDTLANIGSFGFVLGGKCFAGHGVSLTSGSAKMQIKEYRIQ